MDSPFDKAFQECKTFSWNLLSSISVLDAKEKLYNEQENEKLQMAFDALIEHHCKYLTDETVH
jgi:hypothetical protein